MKSEKNLSTEELVTMVKRVFNPSEQDKRMAFLVDVPDRDAPDTPAWKERRELAAAWAKTLHERRSDLGLDSVHLALYRNVKSANANLPATAMFHKAGPLPDSADGMPGSLTTIDELMESHQIMIALTEFSATAPLKIAAIEYGFRAATMPGFTKAMIPALGIDFGSVHSRVSKLTALLNKAERCDIVFEAGGKEHLLSLDLRHRTGHISSGLLHEPGSVGNLPSGEAYITPYEGEIEDDPSQSSGVLPVQIGKDIVLYRVERNRAVEVISDNRASAIEAENLKAEPAYGNIAELGLGVLSDFGIKPVGEILLDEKLGMHIAFGRSDHFGGMVGPDDFSDPKKVVHIDRVYIKDLQPDVKVAKATLFEPRKGDLLLIKDGEYKVDFG